MASGPYGKQQRDRARRDTRTQTAEIAQVDRWCPPSQFECMPGQGTIVIPLSATARILQRLEYEDKRLVYYSISLQCRKGAGAWKDAARVDCSHCEVHLHAPGSPTTIKMLEISRPEDVFDSYDDAYMQILNNSEEYERQWSDGRK